MDKVSQTTEFKALPKNDLITLVESLDRSKLHGESSVDQALVVWTKANETKRKPDFPNLLQYVQFHKTSEEFCDEVISEEKLMVEKYVLSLKLVFYAFAKKLKFYDTYAIGI